jgi:hypothetical protein
VRIFHLESITGNPEFLFKETSNLAIWSTIETGMGITAASFVTLRPLMRLWIQGARNSMVKIRGESIANDVESRRASTAPDLGLEKYQSSRSPDRRRSLPWSRVESVENETPNSKAYD